MSKKLAPAASSATLDAVCMSQKSSSEHKGRREQAIGLGELAERYGVAVEQLFRSLDASNISAACCGADRSDCRLSPSDARNLMRYHFTASLGDWCRLFEPLSKAEIEQLHEAGAAAGGDVLDV